MSESMRVIRRQQDQWAGTLNRDPKRRYYLRSIEENLFRGELTDSTRNEFASADGGELVDSSRGPAKMKALLSSSALAVNFFDPWRGVDKTALAKAMRLPAPIAGLRFEYKPEGYPVKPRSPNLDLLVELEDGRLYGVESKFTEPYGTDEGHGVLSARYFPGEAALWAESGLAEAQALANELRSRSIHLDVPQLLKHLLGLARDPRAPVELIYLWYDTGLSDAVAHELEIATFSAAVRGGTVGFRAMTYQRVFEGLAPEAGPGQPWHRYLHTRYFSGPIAP